MEQFRGLLLITFFFIVKGDDVSRCPPSLQRNQYLHAFRSQCYEFITFRETYWDVAGKECLATGGRLVTIGDMETQQFIMDTLQNMSFSHNGIWIGLSDVISEQQFVWQTGEKTDSFEYWAPGEGAGNFHDLEDCVIMKRTKGYHWEDHPCHVWPQYYSYICEYEMLSDSSTTSPLSLPFMTSPRF